MMRKVGLLIVLLLFGGTVETAYRVREQLGAGTWDWRVLTGEKFGGPSHEYEASAVQAVPAGARLDVQNAFGTVRIVQGAAGEVKVRVRKVVYRREEAEARAFADRIRVDTQVIEGVVTVKTNRDELESTPEGRHLGFETHIDVTVPPATVVAVQNEHGGVEVSDAAQARVSCSYEGARVERVAGTVEVDCRHADVFVSSAAGAVNVTTRHGSAQVRDVQGPVVAVVEHGDLTVSVTGGLEAVLRHSDLTAERVNGDLQVRGEHAGVQASDVTGRAVVETSYRDVQLERVGGDARVIARHGEIRASDVTGAVVAETRFEDVVLARVGGPVDVRVEHGGLRAERLEKGALVRVSGEDVVLDGVKGAVDVQAERAGIRVAPAGAITEAMQLSAKFGSVELEVPAGSRFTLDARTQHGQVEVDVPGLALTQSGDRHVAGSLDGGTNVVTISAESGNVTIRRSVATAAAER